MELTLLSIHQQRHPSLFLGSSTNHFLHSWKKTVSRQLPAIPCRCSISSPNDALRLEKQSVDNEGRRLLLGSFFLAAAEICISDAASATSTSRRALRGAKIPESEFKILPNGLKYYDLKVGGGPMAVKGSRVAVWS